jgi:hypothetical protein
MLSVAVVIYALVGLTGATTESAGKEDGSHCDTVQAGDATISVKHLQSFTVVRHLTLSRGDSVMPFGTQTETLTSGWLNGRPTLLDVLVFVGFAASSGGEPGTSLGARHLDHVRAGLTSV